MGIFRENKGRYPGTVDSALDDDLQVLTKIGCDLASEYGINTPIDTRVFGAYVRYGNQEMHNLAALVGGIASQIALKLCLSQFIPVNNTIIVNGIHMSVGTYKL